MGINIIQLKMALLLPHRNLFFPPLSYNRAINYSENAQYPLFYFDCLELFCLNFAFIEMANKNMFYSLNYATMARCGTNLRCGGTGRVREGGRELVWFGRDAPTTI